MIKVNYQEVVKFAEHYKAIGQTSVYLFPSSYKHDCLDEFPWEYVTDVEGGSGYRLNGPSDFRLRAEHPCGIAFEWTIDFENRDANGKGVFLFDRNRLEAVIKLLPKQARLQFSHFLKTEVIEGVTKITNELREALVNQSKSEGLVWELIAFAELDHL